MRVLLLNAGSSSLKASLVESDNGSVIASGAADWARASTHYQYHYSTKPRCDEHVEWKGHGKAVERFLFDLENVRPVALEHRAALAAVGHRIVHGGHFTSPVCITPCVRAQLNALADLAPLHNPPSLEALAAAEAELPNIPHIAVFDTSFHATIPARAHTYPVPRQWTDEWSIRRYGFHGLSHAYCAHRAAELLGRPIENLRIVICHLGHGCSAAAVQGGQCIDTTMGFTPLEGLMMATRSGSIDPSILLHVMQHHGLSAQQVESALNRQSGLLGVSGVSADMREVLAAAHGRHDGAMLALAIYCHRVRQAIGALGVTMGGVDVLVFTAGVGQYASEVRASICEGLECLGLHIDVAANADCDSDADIARHNSSGRILVIATREDVTMLREVMETLQQIVPTAI